MPAPKPTPADCPGSARPVHRFQHIQRGQGEAPAQHRAHLGPRNDLASVRSGFTNAGLARGEVAELHIQGQTNHAEGASEQPALVDAEQARGDGDTAGAHEVEPHAPALEEVGILLGRLLQFRACSLGAFLRGLPRVEPW